MTHTRNPGHQPGNHWMVCDRCGFDRRLAEMRKEWTGLWVCEDKCWESRHPQDFVRGVPDSPAVPVSRSPPEIVYITAGSVTPDDL